MKKDVMVAVILAITLLFVTIITTSLLLPLQQNSAKRITLATTTSTDNSGLLDYLHPQMEEDTGIKADIVAVGTGAALEQAKQGLVDVVIVHARSLEDQFVADGHGIHRVDLMYNDFIIVGPEDDPAGIQGLSNSTVVFQKLYQARDSISFASRGDSSGTHVKEQSLWEAVGISINSYDIDWASDNSWYLETGSGMGATLTVAHEFSAYTLTDRGTWLFTKKNFDLVLLAEKAPEWVNPYGVILVNPDKFSQGILKFDIAKEYVQWLISDKGQSLIDSYKINSDQFFFADFQNHVDEMSQEELKFWGLTNIELFENNFLKTILVTDYWHKEDC